MIPETSLCQESAPRNPSLGQQTARCHCADDRAGVAAAEGPSRAVLQRPCPGPCPGPADSAVKAEQETLKCWAVRSLSQLLSSARGPKQLLPTCSRGPAGSRKAEPTKRALARLAAGPRSPAPLGSLSPRWSGGYDVLTALPGRAAATGPLCTSARRVAFDDLGGSELPQPHVAELLREH